MTAINKIKAPSKFRDMTPKEMGYDGGDDDFSWGRFFAAFGITIGVITAAGAIIGAVGIIPLVLHGRRINPKRFSLSTISYISSGALSGAVGGIIVGFLAGIPIGIYYGKGHSISFD